MTLGAIEKLLEDETGLDSNSIGRNVVHRVVRLHMATAGISDVDGYYEKLKTDKRELQELIEDVTVPETWFFRDKAPFDLLAALVRDEWMPPTKERPLRILSVPCASGEEAYSIAMVMHGHGFDAGSVRIDAADISKRALTRAAAAVYGENSFRGDEGNHRRRYFDKTDEGYLLRDAIRSMVKFYRGNLLADEFLAGAELYDVIFCRNVMIYFSPELREKAIKKLHRLLAVNGLLFVGHAEASNLNGEYFSAIKHSGAFAFRKKSTFFADKPKALPMPLKLAVNDSHAEVLRHGAHRDNKLARRKRPKHRSSHASAQTGETNSFGVARRSPVHIDTALEAVRRIADEGRLEEASLLCERFLEKNAVNAEAHYLLGLIRQAQENEIDASNYFRKAVYLNPHHYEALVHLAALAESQGNLAAAAVYRSRASRLAEKS